MNTTRNLLAVSMPILRAATRDLTESTIPNARLEHAAETRSNALASLESLAENLALFIREGEAAALNPVRP